MSPSERLNTINIAIQEIENGGQEIRYNGKMIRRGDLGILYAERRRLQDELKQEQGNGGWFRATFRGRG